MFIEYILQMIIKENETVCTLEISSPIEEI